MGKPLKWLRGLDFLLAGPARFELTTLAFGVSFDVFRLNPPESNAVAAFPGPTALEDRSVNGGNSDRVQLF